MASNNFIHELIDARDESEVYDVSVKLAQQVLNADTCHLIALEEEGIEVLAEADVTGRDKQTLPVATDIISQIDLIGRSHVFDDITDVRGVSAVQSAEGVSEYIPRALLLVPIDNLGMLIATKGTPAAFNSADRQWAEQLATFINGVIDTELAMRSDATEVNRLEQVASILSHDFTGPLTVARGALELAEETNDPQYFEQARKAINRIEQLVDGIERLARVDDTFARPELIELRSVAEETWAVIDAPDATLDIRDSHAILADEHAVAQLLANLFHNAIDYGGDDVHIRLGILDGGFFVEDDGPGIDSNLKGDIFQWGVSTDSEHKGIGLSIVQKICDAHDWSISVSESELGGARFSITGVEGP